jgi:hypothetical protein
MPCKSKKPGLPCEVHLVTDMPFVIVMKYVGTHWTIARVVVDDRTPTWMGSIYGLKTRQTTSKNSPRTTPP